MSRALIILLFFVGNASAQSFSGSWILYDVDVFGVKGNEPLHDEIISRNREIYQEKYKGKLIYEFIKNGTMFTHLVKAADTIVVAESEWTKKKNTISTKNLNDTKGLPELFEKTDNVLSQTFTTVLESVTIVIKLSFSNLAFVSRPKHSKEEVNAYFDAGVPAMGKIWTIEGHTDAALAIYDLYENKKMALPHHNDSTYKILEKLTDLKSLEILFMSKKKDYLEVYHLYALSNALLKVGGSYDIAKEGSFTFSKENVMILKAMLLLIDRINALVNSEEVKSKFSFQQQSQASLYQNEIMKAYIASGFLILQERVKQFRTSDICDFGNYFIDFCEKNYQYIPSDSKNDFYKTIEEITKSHHLNCLHRNFKQK